jgi:aspartyl-tRNA(Asn)/glutamyl-tRNA(Gln) amidotransferase subunit C
MPLSQKEVDHIAALARLELTDEQKTQYRIQLSAILDYMAKLSALDLEDVPPTSGAGLTQMSLRADETRPSLPVGTLLANAPDAEDDQFKIPPVFE